MLNPQALKFKSLCMLFYYEKFNENYNYFSVNFYLNKIVNKRIPI